MSEREPIDPELIDSPRPPKWVWYALIGVLAVLLILSASQCSRNQTQVDNQAALIRRLDYDLCQLRAQRQSIAQRYSVFSDRVTTVLAAIANSKNPDIAIGDLIEVRAYLDDEANNGDIKAYADDPQIECYKP